MLFQKTPKVYLFQHGRGSGSILDTKTHLVGAGSNVLGERAFITILKSLRDAGMVLSQVQQFIEGQEIEL